MNLMNLKCIFHAHEFRYAASQSLLKCVVMRILYYRTFDEYSMFWITLFKAKFSERVKLKKKSKMKSPEQICNQRKDEPHDLTHDLFSATNFDPRENNSCISILINVNHIHKLVGSI